jgi:hypothetical protein
MLPGYPARMEKDAAGCPSLLLHYGITNPGTRRTSPAVYPTRRRTLELWIDGFRGDMQRTPTCLSEEGVGTDLAGFTPRPRIVS